MATIRQINSTTKCIGKGIYILWGLFSVLSFSLLTLKGRKGRKEKGNFHNPYNSHTYLARGRLVHFSPPANRNQIASRDIPYSDRYRNGTKKVRHHTAFFSPTPSIHWIWSGEELPRHQRRGLRKRLVTRRKSRWKKTAQVLSATTKKREKARKDFIAVRPLVAREIPFHRFF